jgi:hypothetical protein
VASRGFHQFLPAKCRDRYSIESRLLRLQMLLISSIILNYLHYHHHHNRHHKAYHAHMNGFVLGRCSFRISSQAKAMLTEASQGPRPLPSKSFPTQLLSVIVSFHATSVSMPTAPCSSPERKNRTIIFIIFTGWTCGLFQLLRSASLSFFRDVPINVN